MPRILFVEGQFFAGEHINEAGEGLFLADGEHQRNRGGAETVANIFDDVVEIGAGAVHFI